LRPLRREHVTEQRQFGQKLLHHAEVHGKLVWTLLCALIALVALGILVVITLAIVRV
jgi:hypothetical protein